MGKFIDETGNIYSYLTVIGRSERRPGVYWKCKCICGNISEVQGSDLRRGHIKSCGCKRQESLGALAKDLTNQKFGKLTALYPIKGDKKKRRSWFCSCECGGNTVAATYDLTSGHTTSCGCNRRADLVGKRFGKLIALYTNESNNLQQRIWTCQCDCGNIKKILAKNLISGKTQSCGCLSQPDLSGEVFGYLLVLDYAYSKNNRRYWYCKCECGNVTEVSTDSLQTGNTRSCGCIRSHGNAKIREFLLQHNINFKAEYSFKDCLSEKGFPLRFDFCIINDQNEIELLIEYDGDIHFKYDDNSIYSWNTKNAYERRVLHDKIKDNYCLTNNLKLIRINYKEDLDKRLEELLNEQL